MVGGLSKVDTCLPKAVIHGVGTAVPKFFKYQKDILELMLQHNGFNEASSETKKRNDFIKAIYAGSKIEKRHIANPKYGERTESIKQAMEMYADAGLPLALDASKKALKESNCESEHIKKLIFVTSTGLLAPGVDSMVIDQLGLPRDCARTNIAFMGCGAAITALASAKDFCQSHPEDKLLIVCLELFSLHIGKDEGNDMAIYTSLFADGCAAMVMSGEYGDNLNGKWVVEGNYQYLLENSENAITMGLFERGLFGTININVPNIIKKRMKEFMDRFCANFGLEDIEDIDHWCAHPGGPAILKAVQQALEIHDVKLEHSWECLKQYGNMSSCTVLFIFDRLMKYKETNTSDKMMMLAFGPGVWVDSLLLQKY